MNASLTTHNKTHRPSHLAWLDCIRFFAALLVMTDHFRGAFLPMWIHLPGDQQNIFTFCFYSCTRLGNEAVLVFFVLSGYLVGGISVKKAITGKFNVVEYGIDRFVRIMLPLTSALLLFLLKQHICGNPVDWWAWLGNFLSLQKTWTYAVIEPLWSLAYEVWFYVMAGAALSMIFGHGRKAKWLSMMCLIICFLMFTKLSTHYLLIWLLGAFSYIAMPRTKNMFILVLSSALLICMTIITQLTDGGHVTSEWMQYLPTQNRHSLELIYAVIFCVFLQQVVLFHPRGKMTTALNKLGTRLAAFSYTLYLVHVLVMRVLQHYGAGRPEVLSSAAIWHYVLWCVCALVFSYVVYCCFERNTGVVKDYIKAKLGIRAS